MTKDKVTQELCDFYEGSLFEFAKYLNPHYAYGDIHAEIFNELQFNGWSDQLYLIPRAHLKSHCIAVWCVWWITKHPDTSIVYLSAGQDLADAQMSAIQNMFLCQAYNDLWPEMVYSLESARDCWTNKAINVDHPLRKEMGIRDWTLKIKTVKSNATGLHCDVLVLDDVVVPGNAYTAAGRAEVAKAVTEFSAIKNPGALTKAVGTRYDEKDIYGSFIKAKVPVFDDETGAIVDEKPLWWVMVREVENRGDCTGTFLWPRTFHPSTGKWYGFDKYELTKKRAEMLASDNGQLAHFFAQFYNQTNAKDQMRGDADFFIYLDPRKLKRQDDGWYYRGQKLTITAGMDLAFNENVGSGDFTAIAVVGIDADGWIYVLALDQFRTVKTTTYYDRLIDLYLEWGFSRVYMDVSGSGKVVRSSLQDFIRKDRYGLVVKGVTYSSADGAKEERFAAVLEPRYENNIIYHNKGGWFTELEDQIVKPRPVNDDLEDAVFIAVDNIKHVGAKMTSGNAAKSNVVVANHRFGGRRRA